jgi:shikimate kinase
MKVFMLGLPGSGKTTLGKQLAIAIQVPFVDLDSEIERSEGMSVRNIFAARKEDYFRMIESSELKKWCDSDKSFVMATGGGAPVFFDNMQRINNAGRSVFLDVSAKEIAKRILLTPLEDRPLFAKANHETLKDQIEFMRSHRLPFYRQAHLTISGDMISADEMVRMIRTEIQKSP